MRSLLTVLAFLIVGSLCTAADKPVAVFSIGEKPPPLKLGDFVKGESFKEFQPGTVYVIEFWATWCRPCLDQMPHFCKLRKEYPKAVLLWVDVWDKDQGAVKEFVQRMGDKMDFSVALDSGCDEEGIGEMAKTWLPSLGGKGLPSTVIIDASGKVAWMGAPKDVDKPLKAIVAGTWDLAAAAKEQTLRRRVEETVGEFDARIQKALDIGPAETAKVLAEYTTALDKLRAELKSATESK
jgi:thiol-disulfide isomerase/thioredoxin